MSEPETDGKLEKPDFLQIVGVKIFLQVFQDDRAGNGDGFNRKASKLIAAETGDCLRSVMSSMVPTSWQVLIPICFFMWAIAMT